MTYRLTFNMCKELLLWGLLAALIPVFAGSAIAASGHDDKSKSSHDDKSMDHQETSGAFNHDMTVEGVKAEFQIMSLESMNMKDPDGATHHVMVKFLDAAVRGADEKSRRENQDHFAFQKRDGCRS